MPTVALQHVLIASVFVSLGVVAAALTLQKRASRNRSLRGRPLGFLDGNLHPCALLLVGVGLFAGVAGVAWEVIARREGRLESEALYTLRMPTNLEVADLTATDRVEAGDLIASFRSPLQQAELATLKLRVASLETERKILDSEPVMPDARLVQRLEDLDTELRHLRAAMDQSTMEYREIQRERVRDIQTKTERITLLSGELEQLPQERRRTQADLEFQSSELLRLEKLGTQVVAEQAYEKTGKEVAVLTAEVQRLQAKEASARQQKLQAHQHVRELETLLEQQTIAFERELTSLRARLAQANARRVRLEEELQRDLAKAKQRRQSKLEQIRLDIEQQRYRIEGIERTLTVKAPLSGQVVYHNPSPGTVHRDDPLLVVAPPDAFRFRVRIPAVQVSALRKEHSMTLELSRKLRRSDDVELPPQHLVRRFPARPLNASQLDHDPNMALVEFQCDPPADAVRDLALGQVVRAELVWLPPLYTLPLFAFGMIPLAFGALGVFVARRRRKENRRFDQSNYDPPAANAPLQAVDSDAAAVRLLGEQLAVMVREDELDPSLVATCEWMLDRHGRKGALLLREGILESGPIDGELDRLKSRLNGNGYASYDRGEVTQSERLPERLIFLLDVIAPDAVEHKFSEMRTLPRQ